MNTDLDSDTVKAIFLGDDSGTLISAYDSCNIANYYVSYRHSGDDLQIIDNTDTCSPRTIFDSSLGGWQESSTAGWIPAEDGKYDYPRYTLKSEYNRYNMSLSSSRSPKGCLFSTSDGGFAGYKIVDGVYFNVHEKFDGSKMFADSSYPILYLAIADITKQLFHHIMLVNSAAMGEGYEQAGWMILAGDENGNYYPIYTENAFDWSSNSDGPQIVITTAGWQSEYVDLATGKLKLPANGSTSDVGRSMMIISESSDVTEDLLGNYVGGTPFTKIEGVYKWSNLVESSEETLKLSGNAYKIIQPASGDLTITESDGAENVIILGTISGTLTIENRAVRQLTYIGNCGNLYIDLKDWSTYSTADYPIINLIGEGTATIYGDRMDVNATDSVTVIETSDDGTSAYKCCNIEAGKDIDYRFNVGAKFSNGSNPARFKCDKLTIQNLAGDYSSVGRLIEAYCNYFYVNGNDAFLKNSTTITQSGAYSSVGSTLRLYMPGYPYNDSCAAARVYAAPGSVLGLHHLFGVYDSCTSTYNRSWQTIQEYVDSKTGGDYMTSSQVQSLVDNALVTPVSNISSNTERIATLEESAGNASGGPNPMVLAKSNGPVNAYDTCSTYGAMYLNEFFADNFDSSESLTGYTLLQGVDGGDTLRISYTAHIPSSLHIYVYDASYGADMSGGIAEEIYKDGAWVIGPATYKLNANSGSWKVDSVLSETAARILTQLLSATTKNGVNNYYNQEASRA